jgi:hypothetical protein
MVPIVDPAAEVLVEIGAAAAPGITGRLVQLYKTPFVDEPDRRGETGEAGANDMHAPGASLRSHKKP